MATIEAAFYGDEKSTRNVTTVLRGRVVGDKLSVAKVDDSLIPAFTVTPRGELSQQEVTTIQDKAKSACGGADQDCLKLRTSEFTQETLRAKANDEVTKGAAEVIKGKRLLVRVRDSKGKVSTKIVPENGKLDLDGLSPLTTDKPADIFPKFDVLTKQFIEFSMTMLGMFFWVFSVVATYTLFGQMGWKYTGRVLTLVAILVPNSGWFIIFGYFIFSSFIKNYKAD